MSTPVGPASRATYAAAATVAVATAIAAGRTLWARTHRTAPAALSASAKALADFAAQTADDGLVHLFTFPVLVELSPSLTPFGARVEVFLRMHKIPHEKHVTTDASASPNELVPYIVYKGRVIADSQQIMDFLEEEFHAQPAAAAVDRALATAVRHAVTFELVPFYARTYFTDDAARRMYPYAAESMGIVRRGSPFAPLVYRLLQPLICHVFGNKFRATGYGALSRAQYEERALQVFEALETLLSESPFIAGEEFSTGDAAVFVQLLVHIRAWRAEKARLLAQRGAAPRAAGAAEATRDAGGVDNALYDALFVNDTVQYVVESETFGAYVERISAKAFPDLDDILYGPSVGTVCESSPVAAA